MNLKLFKLKESISIMSLLYSKYGNPTKYYTGMDRVFIIFKNIIQKNIFFIFSSDEFFSKKGYEAEFKDKRILAETLDFFYLKESQFIILYGKNKIGEKCIIAYDFIQDLILFTISLPKEKTEKVQSIRGKINKDHAISHIVLSYEDSILIYEGPFIDGKINKYKSFKNCSPSTKKFIEFGKINCKNSDKVQDVLFLLTEEKTQTEPKINNILVIELNEILKECEIDKCNIKKCFLLDNDTICIKYKIKSEYKIAVIRIILDDDQIKPAFKLEISLEKDNKIFGFKHYIFALDEINNSEINCNIYDYKYIPDEENNSQTEFKIECISNLTIQKKFDSYLKLHHISKEFIFLYNKSHRSYDLVEIYEEEPSIIIDRLVSKKYFEYAKQQAKLFSMSPAEIADIEWKQANFILEESSFDEATRPERAMDHFIKTIGFVPSSFVIQLYLNYKEETLIRYLWGDKKSSDDSIIKNPKTRSSEHLKLLISICVNLYLENKKKELIKDSNEKCNPKQILEDILKNFFDQKNGYSNQFEDCSEDLIDAFLAIGDKENAKSIAENTNNKERMLKLYFDTNDKKKNYENIVNLIFNITSENKKETDDDFTKKLYELLPDENETNNNVVTLQPNELSINEEETSDDNFKINLPENIELSKQSKNTEEIKPFIFNFNEISRNKKGRKSEEIIEMKKKQMKYLNQYGRELFYLDVEDLDLVIKFIEQIANFAINELSNNEYIQQICLLFVPQRSAVNLDLKKISDSELKYEKFKEIEKNYNSGERHEKNRNIKQITDESNKNQQKFKDLLDLYLKFDQTRMSILFYVFYQKIKEELKQTDDDDISKLTINNVYIQHMIILCRNIYKYVVNSKESMKFENKIFFNELKEALDELKYNIDVAFLSIVDLNAEEEFLKFEMLNYICLKHEKYASKLIHLVSVFKSITDDKITSSIFTLCKKFGEKNPNLFIEAITELIQNSRCIDMIPSLLEESSKYIPLPDIITSILQLPSKTLESNRKLNIGLIKKFVVNWMKKMKDYEAKLTEELEKGEEELKNIPNEDYSLDQMKEIRNNYEKMINYASIPQNPNINANGNIPKRPFSTIPISDKVKIESNDLTRGTKMPEHFLEKISDGALIHGLDTDDPNIKKFFSIDKNKMIGEFDQMYELLNQ